MGYRAPTFSIGRDNLWALEILSEEGFLYDSSIFPIRHDLYGFPGAPRFPNRLQFESKRTLYEIPMTTVRMGGMTWPAGGGGYLRLLPMSYTRWAVRQIHEKERQSFMVYVHPWELDPDQPRIAGSWKSRFRHYAGLGRMEKRLRAIAREWALYAVDRFSASSRCGGRDAEPDEHGPGFHNCDLALKNPQS